MNINLPKPVLFAIAIGLQLLVVLSLIIFNANLLISGKEIILQIEPVDPRDFIRGDYITFQYEISSLPDSLYGGDPDELKSGSRVYVTLENAGEYWVAKKITKEKPKQEGLFINGNVLYSYSNIRIDYGIEDYFIPEGAGKAISEKLRTKDAYAKVVVDKSGNAVLKDLIFKDKLVLSNPPAQSRGTGAQSLASVSNDNKRKNDIAAIQKALENYYNANGKYPASGGADIPNNNWSTSNTASWDVLEKELSPYLTDLPKDPVNNVTGWAGDGHFVYGYFSVEYGCSQQWYMLTVKYQNSMGVNDPGAEACDGRVFHYPGAVTVGVCKKCQNSRLPNNNAKYVKLTKPNGKEIICLGKKTEIAWESNGIDLVGIRVQDVQMNGTRFYYIDLNSLPATSDESGESGKGTAVWNVKDIPAGSGYKLEIMGLGADSNIKDTSDSYITIANCES